MLYSKNSKNLIFIGVGLYLWLKNSLYQDQEKPTQLHLMGGEKNGSVFRAHELYKDSPTQVLPSGASCSPGDGHWHRTSPFSTSQPYWQLAMPQVRASNGRRKKMHVKPQWQRGVQRRQLCCSYPCLPHTYVHLLSLSQFVRAGPLACLCDISELDPRVQPTEQQSLCGY